MKIRPAVAADIVEMHRIRLSVHENRLLDPAMIKPSDYVPMMTTRGRGWVAEWEGQIAGFAVADLSRANIWALFVAAEFQGRGIGRALHDTMVSWMFSEGLEHIWLSTEPCTRAERFYRTAGWKYIASERGEARYERTREEWLPGEPRRASARGSAQSQEAAEPPTSRSRRTKG